MTFGFVSRNQNMSYLFQYSSSYKREYIKLVVHYDPIYLLTMTGTKSTLRALALIG